MLTEEKIIEKFEHKEAEAGRPCIVSRVEDFLGADWLSQEERDLLAGELADKDFHSALDALQQAPEEDLKAWAVLYDWPDCVLLSDSYDREITKLYNDLRNLEGTK